MRREKLSKALLVCFIDRCTNLPVEEFLSGSSFPSTLVSSRLAREEDASRTESVLSNQSRYDGRSNSRFRKSNQSAFRTHFSHFLFESVATETFHRSLRCAREQRGDRLFRTANQTNLRQRKYDNRHSSIFLTQRVRTVGQRDDRSSSCPLRKPRPIDRI